ncbi:hypothetical protein AA0242T_0044 [Acetobacter aceti NRIC 0242]|nr:hypothetical protein AA0242T_0044 [Acetobacter aceti NRIC 0242]
MHEHNWLTAFRHSPPAKCFISRNPAERRTVPVVPRDDNFSQQRQIRFATQLSEQGLFPKHAVKRHRMQHGPHLFLAIRR